MTPQDRARLDGWSVGDYARLVSGSARKATKDKSLYRKYLRSDWWKVRRASYLSRHPVCEGCRRRTATQVHHRSYRWFAEVDGDILALCGACHRGVSR